MGRQDANDDRLTIYGAAIPPILPENEHTPTQAVRVDVGNNSVKKLLLFRILDEVYK